MTTAMQAADRPIIFSAPMVKAIIAGTKTQTRRIVKPQPFAMVVQDCDSGEWGQCWDERRAEDGEPLREVWKPMRCPYGVVGDRLWIRERWAAPHGFDAFPPGAIPTDTTIIYAATAALGGDKGVGGLIARNPMFMPRWASRLTLEITEVRVQRVGEISEEDAIAEGCSEKARETHPDDESLKIECGYFPPSSHAHAYRLLWDSIHGPDAWEKSPWTWALTFRRIDSGGVRG